MRLGAQRDRRGRARLEVDDAVVDLVDPEVIDGTEAFALLPAGTKRPPGFLRIDEFLHMRTAPDDVDGTGL